MRTFEEPEVSKQAVKLSSDLYRAFAELRDYGFKDQIRRAGFSVASNIGEGMERDVKADKARILGVAKVSCRELRTQVYIGIDVGYIDHELGQRRIQEPHEISAMLVGLIHSLRR